MSVHHEWMAQLSVHNHDARYPGLRGGTAIAAPCTSYGDPDAANAIDLADAVVQYAGPVVADFERLWTNRQLSTGGATP